MARRGCDRYPYQFCRMSEIQIILFMLLSSTIHKQNQLGLVQALPITRQCNNNVTSINAGVIYEIKSDIYDLSNIWKLCQKAISAPNGQGIDKETSNVCKSAQFNLELLCNMSISKEEQSEAVKVWQTPYDGDNVCQGKTKITQYPYLILSLILEELNLI